jgi:hypothetical protein
VPRCCLAYFFSPSALSISLFCLPDPSNRLMLMPSLFRPFFRSFLIRKASC